MIIGFDAKRLFCNESGLGSYSRSLVSNLLYHHPNIEIHLYTPRINSTEETEFFIKTPNITIHTVPFFRSFWRTFIIPIIARKHCLDVYHGLSAELPLLTFSKAGNSHKVKRILTVHDVIFKSQPNYYNLVDRWIYDIKLKWSLRYADQIICISNHAKSELLKYYKPKYEKLKVINPIVNNLFLNFDTFLKTSEFSTLYNLRNGFWLYVGGLFGRKNINIILEAIISIPHEKRKKLVLITKDNPDTVLKYAMELNIADWIRVEPNISDRVLSLYYKHCTALIYPSSDEGFGLPILEGIAHSAIVICSDHPAHREAGGAMPIYFDHNNSKMLANILTSLSYYERKTIEETLSHLNIYNPKLICESLISVYKEEQNDY